MTESPFDATRWQAALAHQAQLLALAERLLGDPAAADDAVGQALLQESRGLRAAGVPQGPFLRRVVHNAVRRFRRDAATRARHEAAAARVGTAPAADELAAREQLRRRLADAVLALDEPYRTTVALVHLEEVPPVEVARRLGIAEATVRVRLHRARDELRRRLDRGFGSRGAWALVLAWGRPPGAAPAVVVGGVVGGLVMKKLLVGAVGVVLLLGVGAFALRNGLEPAAPPPAEPAPVAAVDLPPSRPAAAAERAAAAPQPTPTNPVPVARSQAFHCVDELGQPIAGAEVQLLSRESGSGEASLLAHSDADGKVVFHGLARGGYFVRARAGVRHYKPDLDPPPLPGPPQELVLRELWIGGVVMPGVEAFARSSSFLGFESTDHSLESPPRAERELVAGWKEKHPDALFWAAVCRPGSLPREGADVTVQWFGHRTVRRVVRMWPASQFQGPEVVDPAAVPSQDWARCRVVLVDASGQPLPEAVQAHLQSGYATLRERHPGQRRVTFADSYTFHGGIAKVPTGEYELCLYDGLGTFVPAAQCTVARDTTELRVPVKIADRVVHLHLRGVSEAGYVLRVVHESGRTMQDLGRADGEHTLLLPPGPCMLTVAIGSAAETRRRFERAYTLTDSIEQDVTWDLTPPK